MFLRHVEMSSIVLLCDILLKTFLDINMRWKNVSRTFKVLSISFRYMSCIERTKCLNYNFLHSFLQIIQILIINSLLYNFIFFHQVSNMCRKFRLTTKTLRILFLSKFSVENGIGKPISNNVLDKFVLNSH